MRDSKPQPSKETDSIQVENFNGLNLVATQMNIPYEESPDMVNCALDPGGAIQGRGGTAVALSTTITPQTNTAQDFDYQSPDGFFWVIRKLGRELYIYQLVGDVLTPYANGGDNPMQIAATPAFAAAAQNVRAVYCASSEIATPRIFVAVGVAQQVVILYNAATATFGATRHAPTAAPASWTGTNWPRTVAIFDGRLYYSGTPAAPARSWSSKAGNFDDFTTGTGPDFGFALDIYAQREQRIVAVYPYRNALIFFARRGIATLTAATFVSGSGSTAGVITYNNFKVTPISSLGAVNGQCVTPVENTLHFIADTGVYELVEASDPGSPYQAGEISIKVTPLFKDLPAAALETATATYDPSRREYWVAMADKSSSVANHIYCYKIQRKGWFIYDLSSYAKKTVIRSLTRCLDTAGRSRILMTIEVGTTAIVSLVWNADRSGRYTDFIARFVGDGVTTSFTHPIPGLLVPTYSTTIAGFSTLLVQGDFVFDPLDSVMDLTVTVNGVETSNYLKVGESTIQMGFTLEIGDVVVMSYTPDVQVQVLVDNIEQDPTAISISGDMVTLDTPPANNAVVELGVLFRAYYDTYELNFGSIRNLKRLRYIYVYAKAIEDTDTYTLQDYNAASSQDPSALAFLPRANGQLDIRYWKDGKKLKTTKVADVYYNPAGVWDLAVWDAVFPSNYQSNTLKVGLSGVCKYVTFRFYSRSAGTFVIPGWQADVHHHGRR